MIKLEHVVFPSPKQMEFVIEGMRNPMNSWDKTDSEFGCVNIDECPIKNTTSCDECPEWHIGVSDYMLMKKLSNAGTDHRKFMRMMPVMVRITAPLYWWKEFDTYKVGTVANSCSTMHKIIAKEFTLEDFSTEHLIDWDDNFECDVLINKGSTPDGYPCGISPVGGYHVILALLNEAREKYLDYNSRTPEHEWIRKRKMAWWQLIQLLPSSYNQTRNVMLNYEVLANIYPSRKNHKLDEWHTFCDWIEKLPYHELITGVKED